MDFTHTKIFEINFSIANTSLNLHLKGEWSMVNGQWSQKLGELLPIVYYQLSTAIQSTGYIHH